jgi:hypothetical protein
MARHVNSQVLMANSNSRKINGPFTSFSYMQPHILILHVWENERLLVQILWLVIIHSCLDQRLRGVKLVAVKAWTNRRDHPAATIDNPVTHDPTLTDHRGAAQPGTFPPVSPKVQSVTFLQPTFAIKYFADL